MFGYAIWRDIYIKKSYWFAVNEDYAVLYYDKSYLKSYNSIEKLKLNANIVILSACNTASEDGSPNGEGMSGLTSAFFQAGTKSMLVTHWDVETNSAVQLTTGSLKNLENSESLSKALQKTKISMMNNKDTAHPFYWAPYVLIGNLNNSIN